MTKRSSLLASTGGNLIIGIAGVVVDLPVQELFVRVLQPGRTRIVTAHVVLPVDFQLKNLSHLDELRTQTLVELQKEHPSTFIDLIFTTDRFWGGSCH